MNIIITNRAKKDLEKLDKETRIRIYTVFEDMANKQRVDIKKIRGTDNYRVRVGDYRIIINMSNDLLTIYALRILHRREAYTKR